ncbi:MAG: hypothetical protein ACO1NN_12705 [Sphingopyxis sp.]
MDHMLVKLASLGGGEVRDCLARQLIYFVAGVQDQLPILAAAEVGTEDFCLTIGKYVRDFQTMLMAEMRPQGIPIDAIRQPKFKVHLMLSSREVNAWAALH